MTTKEHSQRPWGHYTVLEDDPLFKVKRIEVLPHQSISYQRHTRRSEHWFIVTGEGIVTLNDVDLTVCAGSSIDISNLAKHRIRCTGTTALIFIEVQTGTYFGEDDIERFHDEYGRI